MLTKVNIVFYENTDMETQNEIDVVVSGIVGTQVKVMVINRELNGCYLDEQKRTNLGSCVLIVAAKGSFLSIDMDVYAKQRLIAGTSVNQENLFIVKEANMVLVFEKVNI